VEPCKQITLYNVYNRLTGLNPYKGYGLAVVVVFGVWWYFFGTNIWLGVLDCCIFAGLFGVVVIVLQVFGIVAVKCV
jgi:hypothetical protein